MEMTDRTPEQQELDKKALESARKLFSEPKERKSIDEMRMSLLKLESALSKAEKAVPNEPSSPAAKQSE